MEIAHVLAMDIVDSARLPIEQQRLLLAELEEVIRTTAASGDPRSVGYVIHVPAADGMVLVFLRDLVAPFERAVLIARALQSRSYLRVRMGLHSGPVRRAGSRDASANAAGGGITIAQRVMDCGDGGHILVSAATAELMGQVPGGVKPLEDLGEWEITPGLRLRLFNLYTQEVGNPERPQRLRAPAPPPAPAGPPTPGQSECSETHRDRAELAPEAEVEAMTPPTGVVSLGSKFYIVRPSDDEFRAAITRRDSIVRIKGARQMGKTSLLARGLQQAREAGARVLLTDFQMLHAAHLASAETFFVTLARWIAKELHLATSPDEVWDPLQGPNWNFREFMLSAVLNRSSAPLVWGLDEVDRLFLCDFGPEVFGLFRAWHNERALNPTLPWARLTLAMAYATEAHLFITDLNQSPFNVGTRVTLQDFTLEQVADLNHRYRSPLRDEIEVARYYRLVGGHPYLTHRGLHEMITHGLTLAALEGQADRDEGLFGDHLRRMVMLIARDPDLLEAARGVLQGQPCATPTLFYRLWSAGVVTGESARSARPRCELYGRFLERQLL